MSFKELSEKGKEYLTQLDNERIDFIMKSNNLKLKLYNAILDIEKKLSQKPESPENKNTDDSK